MSSTVYLWGGEHFCAIDAADLYRTNPRRLNAYGFPAELTQAPESFCSACLMWWVGPHDHEDPMKITITQHSASVTQTKTSYTDPEEALHAWEELLMAAGHANSGAYVLTLAAVLMKGGTGYAVPDPDLKGSIEISIERKARK